MGRLKPYGNLNQFSDRNSYITSKLRDQIVAKITRTTSTLLAETNTHITHVHALSGSSRFT